MLKTLKVGLGKVKKGVVGGGEKMLAGFQKLASGGLKEITKLKNRIKSLFKKKKTDPDSEQIKENSIASQNTKDGHTLETMPDGSIAKCSDCDMLSNIYKKELNSGTPEADKLKQELTDLQKDIKKRGFTKEDTLPDDLLKKQLEIERKLFDLKRGPQTQTNSKTVWKGNGKERIDVENPNPDQRPGQVHYQDNAGNKYVYDAFSKQFKNAPASINKLLTDPRFMNGIKKGLKYLGYS